MVYTSVEILHLRLYHFFPFSFFSHMIYGLTNKGLPHLSKCFCFQVVENTSQKA